VILLRAGKIEQAGAPAALYARPASSFAARFIGTPAMNLVRLAAVQPGGAPGLTLGIRPEHIRIVGNGAAGVAAQVVSAEYHGADTIVAARVGGETLLVRTPGEVTLAPGSPIRLGWEDDAVHIFDAESGVRRSTTGGKP
jgi:sn-glycerol 3-phosphate transport system ATP-binding protein